MAFILGKQFQACSHVAVLMIQYNRQESFHLLSKAIASMTAMLPSDARMHGGFAAEEVVVEQRVAFHTCVDLLQGVSSVKKLLPFPGVAQTWTEDAHGMLSIVDLEAHHTLAFITASTMQSVFHDGASVLPCLALGLETGVDHVRTSLFCGLMQYILPHSVNTTALTRSSQNTRSGYHRTAHPSTFGGS